MAYITKKAFLKHVLDEAERLKIHATDRERAKIDPDNIRAISLDKCVYGQITGCCIGARASELIKLCATLFFSNSHQANRMKKYSDVAGLAQPDYDMVQEQMFPDMSPREGLPFLTALEQYIIMDGAQVIPLGLYIRGDISEVAL